MFLSRFVAFLTTACLLSFASTPSVCASEMSKGELQAWYQRAYSTPSDINEHVPVLRRLASECSSVVELGLRSMVSSWGILYGLAEGQTQHPSYLGVDINFPPDGIYKSAKRLALNNGIDFQFMQANDMEIEIEPVDMIFIDSLHTYCHLSYELEKFSAYANKYIVMHDTSDPWGERDDQEYYGNYSEYPAWIDRNKRGLWAAVSDFLDRHPEWKLGFRLTNSHGLTLLQRTAKEG